MVPLGDGYPDDAPPASGDLAREAERRIVDEFCGQPNAPAHREPLMPMSEITASDAAADGFRLGVVVPLTGGQGITGQSISRGALLAISEVNADGGIGGVPIIPVVRDTTSSVTDALRTVRSLVREEDVRVCVGAYTSAGRVALTPTFRDADGLLLYPTYYEGLEHDPHVLYAGAVPNQYLGGYLDWILANLGRRLYVIGSDYVYPRTVGQIVQRVTADRGAEVVADRYVPLGQIDFAAALDEIRELQPDVIVCNLVGNDSVPAFYRQFYDAGFRASDLPIAATVTSEVELQVMGPECSQGHYMAASYFSSLDNVANVRHRDAFRQRFGSDAVMEVVGAAAYNAVWLLALAGRAAGGVEPAALRRALPGITFDGSPEGSPITVCENHHTTHGSFVGIADAAGEYQVIATSGVRDPDPYPALLVPPDRRPVSTVAGAGGPRTR